MEKISKNQLKYISSLLQKKYRKAENKFLTEGKKLVSEALNSSYPCELLAVTEKFLASNKSVLNLSGLEPHRIVLTTEKEMERLADTVNPQGITGVFGTERAIKIHRNHKIIVALENISDPGNLGTILRNCDWFGVTEILLSQDCAEVFNPKVLRASMGSVFHLDVKISADFYDNLQKLRDNGYKILNSNLNGENIYRFKMPDKIIAVFSNEANGPTERISLLADENITIPKFGNAESLNVASSSAIILSEIFAANQVV